MILDFTPTGIIFTKENDEKIVFILYSAISMVILQPELVWTGNFLWEKTGKYQIKISITSEVNTLSIEFVDYDTANDMYKSIMHSLQEKLCK